MKQYDYLLVGSGLYNGVLAYLAGQAGKKCLVLEKRDHIGGNIYCEEVEGIHVHKYGAHIFHTSSRRVWDFVNHLTESQEIWKNRQSALSEKIFTKNW